MMMMRGGGLLPHLLVATTLKLAVFVSLIIFPQFSSCSNSVESFIYVGCTQLRYDPGSPFESSVNSVVTSLVNSASISNYNHFQNDAVSGLYQCRGDLTSSDCHTCVASAVTRLATYCAGTSGAALQLDGCFIKYDNTSFVGAQDKTVVSTKCAAPLGYEDSELETRRDAVLAYLSGGGQYFRVGGSGKVQGMVQCVQDLSMAQCQDCLSEAVQRLKTECAMSPWGDMFLAKCYARYSQGGAAYTPASRSGYYRESDDDNDETEKTLALIIGLIAAVTLLVIFLSFLSKSLSSEDDK